MRAVWEPINTGIGEGAAFWLGDKLAALTIGGGPEETALSQEKAHGVAFSRGYHPGTGELLHQLEQYLAGERTGFTIPLRYAGTAMQHSVWSALAQIPYGERISYLELARRVDCRSHRAVGTAVGKNPLPILLPCHRVVRGDGKIGNYSCANGPETKRRLLDLETATAASAQR